MSVIFIVLFQGKKEQWNMQIIMVVIYERINSYF